MNTEATQKQAQTEFFGTEPVFRILFRLAPPIMCAQLVSALYNIIDSFFVGKLADSGLTALSVIFPLQLLINALGAGTGIGVNTVMAKRYGEQQPEEAQAAAGTGTLLAVCSWLGLVILMLLFFPAYVSGSTSSDIVRRESLEYGWIVCLGSLPQLMDHVWIKIHQAEGNMRLPMMAQILGSAVNILLDPLLIFGMPGFPALGIRGAAIATVAGQIAAALVTGMHGFRRIPTAGQIGRNALLIYQMGFPAIVMQGFYSVYITGLNLVLISFSETAVTVLGLYYKLQTFFFIPFMALESCIVPILSYNYSSGNWKRCKTILLETILFGIGFMLCATLFFEAIPGMLLRIFTSNEEVWKLGVPALRIIGTSFVPAVFSLLFPIFFQSIGKGPESLALTILRQAVLFVPTAWLLARIGGLSLVWFTFPVTEFSTGTAGCFLFFLQQASVKPTESLHPKPKQMPH